MKGLVFKVKNLLKLAKIIGIFFVSLFIISFIWYHVEVALYPDLSYETPFIDYVLYIIGYGDISIKDHYLQTGFSIIALFTMTLLSSVFTVSLFELRSKASLLPTIEISNDDSKYFAHASIKTIGKDIYDVTAVLIAKIGDEIYSENIYLPYISRKTIQKIKFSFDVGSPLYKYMRASLEGKEKYAPLIITLAYTDIENGQEYKSCAKFNCCGKDRDFVYTQKELLLEVDDYLLKREFALDLTEAKAINDEDVVLSVDKANAMCVDVKMTSKTNYEAKSFVMACLRSPLGGDWSKYADLGCCLTFDYLVSGGITPTLELKFGDKVYTATLCGSKEEKHFSLPLKSVDADAKNLSWVRELCFTVFYENTDREAPRGSFVIKNCSLNIE